MFPLLLLVSLAIDQTPVQLTTSTFRRLVQGRKSHEVWLVMFAGPNCPACQEAYPHFSNASNIAAGMIRFGIVDIQRSQEVANEYDVRTLPTFRIFYSRGDTEFVGKRKEREFMNQAASFLDDLSQPVERSWLDSMLARPSAILFTEKPKTPPIWAGVAAFFYGKLVRIGISKEDPEMMKLFNITNTPKIVFMNGTGRKIYDGKIAFRNLKNAIESYFEKRLKSGSDEAIEADFLTPGDFEPKCLGGRQNCIIYIGTNPHPTLQQLAKRHASRRMRWFVGVHELPYPFMNPGEVWIYNPRRDGFVKVDDIAELSNAIDLMLDGTAKWTSRQKLLQVEADSDSL
jgi:thiol-disulfide isomerase/thioredoxin